MLVDLTDEQKALINWLAREIDSGRLAQKFYIVWTLEGKGILSERNFTGSNHPPITKSTLDTLEQVGLLFCTPHIKKTVSTATKYRKPKYRQRETHRQCALTQKAYEAIISNFDWLMLETRVVIKDEY